jgi:hypothetical protein
MADLEAEPEILEEVAGIGLAHQASLWLSAAI